MDPLQSSGRRRLSLARALRRDVPASVRERGYTYFASGAVTSLAASETAVAAAVKGTRDYRVRIWRERDGYAASCDCPYFDGGLNICKHIWAVVLAADQHAALVPASFETWLDPAPSQGADDAPALTPLPQQASVRRPPSAWERFLDGILAQAAADEASHPVPKYVNGELMYVIDQAMTLQGHGIVVFVWWRQRKKNGEWGKPQPAAISPAELTHLPDAVDREVLATLAGAGDGYSAYAGYAPMQARASFRIQGPITDRAVWLLASSRRLYLRVTSSPVEELRPIAADVGPPWQFRLDVAHLENGDLRVSGALARGDAQMPITEPQLVLASGHLIARGTIARLDHGSAFVWLAELRRTGSATFSADSVPALAEALARSQVAPAILPPDLRYEIADAVPEPRVLITRNPPAPRAYTQPDDLSAAVQFSYEGVSVPAESTGSVYVPGRRRLLRRNRAAELAAVQRLASLGFRRGWGWGYQRTEGLTIAASQFSRAVRILVAEGWHVEAEGEVFRTARRMQVRVKSGVDWFELHGDLDFGDGRSVPLTELLSAITRGDPTIVLDDGTRGMVPEDWLRRYARIAGFGQVEGDHVRYRPSQTALLDALLEAQPGVDVDDGFRRARDEMRTFGGVRTVTAAASFRGTLREYQQEALGWFDFLRRFGFGGCLADDMGLGKTVMVLALLDARRHDQPAGRLPSLTVVPRSLVFNWIAEARRFAPELRVLDYTGPERAGVSLADYDLVLTTYGTLRRDAARLNAEAFDYVILDEAQAIKNATTASAKAARLLRGRHRLALSGTPVENHIGELWSLFEFLNPGLLGSSSAFRRASSVQSRDGGEDLALVSRALKPLILRRTKDQVAPELPSRTEQIIYCELDEAQRRFYNGLRAHYRSTLLARVERDGLNRSKIHVLEALLRLRQAACHSGLVDARHRAQPSAKFDVLVPQLLEVIDEGHKALVFSQFTELLGLLRKELDASKVTYEYLDGRTRDRAARVERFSSDPACRVFLISLKAGGLGLNLTAAEYVFLLDPWWNPAVEAQAIDRAHRIGQARHVFAYRLIARDTVEEKVAELQASKRELADAILTADPSLVRNLRTEDLDLLLS